MKMKMSKKTPEPAWLNTGAHLEKPTPGPWHISKTGNHQRVIVGAGGENVAVVYDAKDATVLAAAPGLLEALEMLCPLTHLETCAGVNFRHGTEERESACTCGATKARSAIAKAKGEA